VRLGGRTLCVVWNRLLRIPLTSASSLNCGRIRRPVNMTESVLSIVTRLRNERSKGSNPLNGRDFFCSSISPDRLSARTQPSIQWVPGLNRRRHEINHLPLSGVEVKNEWRYALTFPVSFD
jgi:hypothetical protein